MVARKSFLLRMDPALWQALERCAVDELRSVNAEVEFLLREALRQRGRWSEQTSEASPRSKKSS